MKVMTPKFSRDAAGGFRYPFLGNTLFSGSKKRAKIAFFAPRPVGDPPIPFPDALPWLGNSHYRYLGLDLTNTLDWSAHWDRAVRGTLYRYNTIAFHRSSVMARMPAARLLQLRKVYLQPYAWSCLAVPGEISAYWNLFLHSTGCAAFHFDKTHASRLLTACLSATPSANALQLRERLRLFLQLKSHVSRLSPPAFPRHASVTLFDALVRDFSWHAQQRTLYPPPNWVADVAGQLDLVADSSPLRVNLLDLNVQWAFQIPDYLRPLTAGVTYFEFRRAEVRNIKPVDLLMGPQAPRTDGPTRSALSLSFGLSADPACFMPGSRPLPLSLIGPGCNHIVSLATEVHSDEVLRLIRGNSAFRLPPWVGVGQDGRALTPPVPPGGAPLGANWNSMAGCHLCGETDGPPHAFGSCPYGTVAAVRTVVTQHALGTFLPFLIGELRRLRLCPSDSRPPLELHLSPEEELALGSVSSRRCDGVLSNELSHIMFRLVTASPWPRRVAQPGHHLASALGALFDAVIAAPQALRPLANRWMRWAKVAISKVARARLQALTAEASSPSFPRPPPWNPPGAPGASALDDYVEVERGEDEDGGAPRPPPPPARQARAPRNAPVPVFSGRGYILRGPMSPSWYARCNKAALLFLYGRVRSVPALVARLPPGAPAAGDRCTKAHLAELLNGLSLDRAAVEALGVPAARPAAH